jgi:formylglycine-generating enzyme required for sulfatase activity
MYRLFNAQIQIVSYIFFLINCNYCLQAQVTPPAMVYVEGGTFLMGCSPERGDTILRNGNGCNSDETSHKVSISSFYIGKYEVSQKEWKDIMKTVTGWGNPSFFSLCGNYCPVERVNWYAALVYCNLLSMDQGKNPVYKKNYDTNPDNWGSIPIPPKYNDKNWDAITMDVSANGYRLPTEAEWEFAARGGLLSQGYPFAGGKFIDDIGWYYGNSLEKTHQIGQKSANELGIYDMTGNVWEWCWDRYDVNYYREGQCNPLGNNVDFSCVLRGSASFIRNNKVSSIP